MSRQVVLPPSLEPPLPVLSVAIGVNIEGSVTEGIVRLREPQGWQAPNSGTTPGSDTNLFAVLMAEYRLIEPADQVRKAPPCARARQHRAHPRRVDPRCFVGSPVRARVQREDAAPLCHHVHRGEDLL